ncbi:MAG: redoxin domain-containing protein [Verrucomicrobiota bacterium]
MHTISRILLATLAALVWTSPVRAQEPGPLPGHSSHGEVFNEGPRQKAYLMKGTGHVDFRVTTSSAEAQAFFNQGVGQLHGFWYFEAERSFRQMAVLDPDCAMAYWGMAMANEKNAKRAKEFIARASALKGKASRREQLWIENLAKYYADEKKSNKEREKQLIDGYTAMAKEFPDDIEIKAFLALQTWESNGSNPIKDYDAVNNLIGEVLAVEPMHPVHHYRIHLWDSKKAENALGSAALCGQSSFGIAHMWHMPGHIYSKVQRYSDAAWQQEASARVDHLHMMQDRVLPDQIHNYAHNNEWLVRDLVFIGRVHDAIELAENMIELPRLARRSGTTSTNSTRSPYAGTSYGYGRTRLLEVLTRYELWPELLSLSKTMYLEPKEDLDERIRIKHAVGLAHFALGEPAKGEAVIGELQQMLEREKKATPATRRRSESSESAEGRKEGTPAEKPATEEPKPSNTSTNRAPAGRSSTPSRTQTLESALAELRALSALAKGNVATAREQLGKTKDIQKERLARTWLELGDKQKAEQLAREAANSGKKQVQPLASYVDILYRTGKYALAYSNFFELRDLSAEIDLDMPVFQRLLPVAKDLKFSSNWRIKPKAAGDVGQRPGLSKLGPFRWQPSPAPDWSLPDANGKKISLRLYRGKPVIVVFYLGYGCSHCIQQLNAFAPMTKRFAEAGISIVAVSTDTAEGLKKTFAKSESEGGFPFPLVSDEKLKVFKAYRAFDDFENVPLHGTFLVDGDGLVRWQDINYQPFTQMEFLFEESQRLLNLPKNPLFTEKAAKNGARGSE